NEGGNHDREGLASRRDVEASALVPHRSRLRDLACSGGDRRTDAIAGEGHGDLRSGVIELDVDVLAREAVVAIAGAQVIEARDGSGRACSGCDVDLVDVAIAVPRRDLHGVVVSLEV